MAPVRGEVIELSSSPEPQPLLPRRSSRARSRSISAQPQSHPRSQTSKKAAANASLKGKAKGKGKAPTPSMVQVIELTDSEDELPTRIYSQSQSQRSTATSGSSSQQQPRTQNSSTSTTNYHIIAASSKRTSLSHAASSLATPVASGSGSATKSKTPKRVEPLFLQSPPPPSDEDDGEDDLATLILGGGKPGSQSKDKGKGRVKVVGPDPEPQPPAEPFAPMDVGGDFEIPFGGDAPVGVKDREVGGANAAFENEDFGWVNDFWGDPFPFMMEDNDPAQLAEEDNVPHQQEAGPPPPEPGPAPVAVAVEQPPAPQPALDVEVPVFDVPDDPEPAPQEPPPDPLTHAIAQILEIIPNVCPEYLLGVVNTHLPTMGVQTAEHVLGLLFEDGNYPRVDPRKGKKRASDANEVANAEAEEKGNKKARVDYESVDREYEGGVAYFDLALIYLQSSFRHIPKPYLRKQLLAHQSLYAPTVLAIKDGEEHAANMRSYSIKSTLYNPAKDMVKLRRALGKGADEVLDEAFEEERKWVEARLGGVVDLNGGDEAAADVGKGKGKEKADDDEEEELPEGEGIECQCCFAEYRFDKMVQCPEAHLFCQTCVSQYAATQLGAQTASIVCMHSSDCRTPFPVSELQRILDPKLMALYERIKQRSEIEAAGLEGLEECPFCEFKCVIEASMEEEKLFRCGNDDGGCGVVSCRECKKVDHLPKSCKEMEEDKVLDGRHAIEEAMSRALMRNCPKCQKAFIKEQGCNKMTCPHCHTLSCYICRQVIKSYDHFNQAPANAPGSSKKSGKCLLWDPVEQRHADEVKAAAEKARAEYKRDHPDVEDDAIKVDLPAAPAPAPAPAPPINHIPHQFIFNPAMHMAGANAAYPNYPVLQVPMPYLNVPAYWGQAVPAPQPVQPVYNPHLNLQNHQAARAAEQQHARDLRRVMVDRQRVLREQLAEQARAAQEVAAAGARFRDGLREERLKLERAQLQAQARAQVQAQAQLNAQHRQQAQAQLNAQLRQQAQAQTRIRAQEVHDRVAATAAFARNRTQAQARAREAKVRLDQARALATAQEERVLLMQETLRTRARESEARILEHQREVVEGQRNRQRMYEDAMRRYNDDRAAQAQAPILQPNGGRRRMGL